MVANVFFQQALRRKQVDLCELLGSGKPPENGTISLQDPVRQMRADGPYDLESRMPLQLSLVSDHKDILGDDCVREFREDGGTIGRSLENDWILPDPDRFISGKHATVDFQGGAYYLADVSTNGVYVNGEDKPLGRGNPRRLFNGDKLRMGDFVFQVSLDEGEGLTMPPPEPMTAVPDHVARLVPEELIKTGVELIAEEAITGDDEFHSALFGTPAKDKAAENGNGPLDKHANPFAPGPTSQEKERLDLEKLLDAFMRGLDISRADIAASTNPLTVMENAGRVLKEFVDGSSQLLASRTALKTMFRLDQTTVMDTDNNPLKFAKNTRESMMQLLVGDADEYISPVEAVREVFQDLKIHHDSVLEGMISAFVKFIDRFDPAALQENFDRTLDKKPLFAAMNQLKYWQLYCDLYPIMTQQSSGTFPHQFGEDFVRYYEEHCAAFKAGGISRDTQRIPVNQEQMPAQYDKDNLVDQTEEAGYDKEF